MEETCQIVEVERKSMRLLRLCRGLNYPWIFCQLCNQLDLMVVGDAAGRRRKVERIDIDVRKRLARLAEYRHAACVRVLHVEDGVILGLLRDLGEVEVERFGI